MPAGMVPDAELGLLLYDFQAEIPEQAEQFVKIVTPILKSLARRCASDLPSDIPEEVVGETFALLLRSDLVRFDVTRGTAIAYLFGFVRNAVTHVRTSYGRPRPMRTKDAIAPTDESQIVRKKGSISPTDEPQIVSLDQALQKFQIEYPEPSLHQKITAHQILEKAPDVLQFVFERVYYADEPLTQVAANLGIDRFVIRRQVATFAQQFAQQFTDIQRCA